MNKTVLILIDVNSMIVTRYVGRVATHKATASYLDAGLIEQFRISAPDDLLITKPAAT